jgi:CRISPR-associated endonuclease Cas1
MAEQEIDLVQLDWRGRPLMVGGNSGYAANPTLVDAQRAAQRGPRKIAIARWLIEQKVAASIATLEEVIPKSPDRDAAIVRLNRRSSELRGPQHGLTLPRIRGIEGDAAAAYFGGWQGVPLKWSGVDRRPIPESWREIGPRKMGWRRSGQNARHPVNAMLNYAYGVLISQLRSQIVAAGLDPTIGIMHGTSQNRIPLVYDLMEPLRPVVDRRVLAFALAQTFAPGDFTINKLGGCRLNPQLATTIAAHISELKVASLLDKFVAPSILRQ